MRSATALLIGAALIIAAVGVVAWRGWFGGPFSAGPATAPSLPQLTGPDKDLAAAASGPTWFSEVKTTGIDFAHVSGTGPEKPFPAANGSGLAAVDFDCDGRLDVYFLTGTPFPIAPSPTSPYNRLYRSLGNWRFADVTAASQTALNGFQAGVAAGDYDNDGFPDLYVNCYGANCLLHNLGDGTFERVEHEAGVADERWGTSAAFLDADRDGLLDLYVCNYAKWTLEINEFCGDRARNIRLYCGPNTVQPEDDVFYHNQGDGTFRDATSESGLASRPGRGQGVVAADVNDDGAIDIYVGNDLTPNLLFVNRGNGSFRDISEASGTAYDFLGANQAGMGVDAADVNNDGRFDLFVTNFEAEHNTLYENRGHEIFQDVSRPYGLATDSLPWIGWGTVFADYDFDGWLDLVVTNGHVDDNRHLLGQTAQYHQPPLLWHNRQSRFSVVAAATAGDYFQGKHVGRALAPADLDNDGDLDLIIGHQDAPPALLRNEKLGRDASAQQSLVVRLIGTSGNRDAVGSRLGLQMPDGTIQWRQVKGGGSYLSASDLRQFFGVPDGGDGPATLPLSIRWPAGQITQIDVQPGRSYSVWEPASTSAPTILHSSAILTINRSLEQ
jgi:enediyne biosynthesis protein E4